MQMITFFVCLDRLPGTVQTKQELGAVQLFFTPSHATVAVATLWHTPFRKDRESM